MGEVCVGRECGSSDIDLMICRLEDDIVIEIVDEIKK